MAKSIGKLPGGVECTMVATAKSVVLNPVNALMMWEAAI
jgi:hypothetical protein